jgi:hypothetical protein
MGCRKYHWLAWPKNSISRLLRPEYQLIGTELDQPVEHLLGGTKLPHDRKSKSQVFNENRIVRITRNSVSEISVILIRAETFKREYRDALGQNLRNGRARNRFLGVGGRSFLLSAPIREEEKPTRRNQLRLRPANQFQRSTALLGQKKLARILVLAGHLPVPSSHRWRAIA